MEGWIHVKRSLLTCFIVSPDAADYLTNKVCQESSSGSARTDYRRNLILSDRAKKRRKLLKEKIGEASSNLSFSTNCESLCIYIYIYANYIKNDTCAYIFFWFD